MPARPGGIPPMPPRKGLPAAAPPAPVAVPGVCDCDWGAPPPQGLGRAEVLGVPEAHGFVC